MGLHGHIKHDAESGTILDCSKSRNSTSGITHTPAPGLRLASSRVSEIETITQTSKEEVNREHKRATKTMLKEGLDRQDDSEEEEAEMHGKKGKEGATTSMSSLDLK